MRFTTNNVNVEQLQEAIGALNGQSAQLELITRDDLDEMVALFSNPDVYRSAHLRKPPTKEVLDDFIHDDLMLFIWRIFPSENDVRGPQAGYIAWVNYAGPPFLMMVPTSEEFDLDVFQDGAQLVLQTYFTQTPGDELRFYMDHPVPEEIHHLLTEAGFDLWQEVAGVDPEEEATYIMERGTFQAYYIDVDDDDDY